MSDEHRYDHLSPDEAAREIAREDTLLSAVENDVRSRAVAWVQANRDMLDAAYPGLAIAVIDDAVVASSTTISSVRAILAERGLPLETYVTTTSRPR